MESTLLQVFFGFCIVMMILLRLYGTPRKTARERRSYFPEYTPSLTRSYKGNENFNDAFYHNLQLTINYTAYVMEGLKADEEIKYNKVLRTINALWKGKPLYTFTEEEALLAFEYFDYQLLLKQTLQEKQRITAHRKKQPVNGRILRFETGVTTRDGAPCWSSGYFVDDNDIPPIDTWFYVTPAYLYCFIPAACTSVMQQAIDVEILNSYLWLDEYKPELYKQIIDKLEHIR